jgi:predicted short-subunit dehydrogenase-like oxidoreductase (DUF2520 family)
MVGNKPRLGFIGAGTVGTALAVRLSERGYPVVAVSSRTVASAERLAAKLPQCRTAPDNQSVADAADFVFITTSDDAIATVAGEVNWHPGQSVVHCSGADSTATLQPARDAGAVVGAIHPLQTFASVDQAMDNLAGSTFALEAEKPLLGTLKRMAAALDGFSIVLEASDKVAYHAAAVMACNYMVTLVKLATDLWQTFDVPPDIATRALMPLLKGTLANIESLGVPRCLTGPIARGDTGTVRKHIDALLDSAPNLLPTYRELGRQTVPIAMAKGKIDHEQARSLLAMLASLGGVPEGNGVTEALK